MSKIPKITKQLLTNSGNSYWQICIRVNLFINRAKITQSKYDLSINCVRNPQPKHDPLINK